MQIKQKRQDKKGMEGMRMRDNEIAYEIVKRIGVINRYPTGWNKEINLVSWNGGAAKYDIRDWDPDHARMSRGVTLTEQEFARMMNHVLDKEPEIKNIMENEKHKAQKDMER